MVDHFMTSCKESVETFSSAMSNFIYSMVFFFGILQIGNCGKAYIWYVFRLFPFSTNLPVGKKNKCKPSTLLK